MNAMMTDIHTKAESPCLSDPGGAVRGSPSATRPAPASPRLPNRCLAAWTRMRETPSRGVQLKGVQKTFGFVDGQKARYQGKNVENILNFLKTNPKCSFLKKNKHTLCGKYQNVKKTQYA